MLETYSIAGENTHNATDDIKATINLANYFYPIIQSKTELQKGFIRNNVIQTIKHKLITNYLPIYNHTKEKIFSPLTDEEHTFIILYTSL